MTPTDLSLSAALPIQSREARVDWFQRWALYTPGKVAIKDDASGRVFTYGECDRLINRAARILRDEWDATGGKRVAVLATNEVEYLFLLFAVQRIGAILVPVNFRLAPREIAHVLQDSGASLLISQRQFDEALDKIDALDRLTRVPFDGENGYVSRLYDEKRSAEPIGYTPRMNSGCMILYTSGTTGAPKGALITNEMIFWNSVNTTMRLDVSQKDVTLTYTPLFYTGGWHVLTTPFLHRGASIIFMKKFDPDRILQLCDSEQVTILFGIPTLMQMLRLSEHFPKASLKSVRFAIVGGEPMPLELIREWHRKGVPIRQGYGLTEFGPNVFSLQEEHAESKIGSIGFPNFYVDADVFDESDTSQGPDSVGELVLRGPVCTPGYWNNPKATAEAIRNGWFHTGDLVRRDTEGFYYVVDRKKDMYKSGGANVYPAEIEHVLRENPKIREVAVVGVPDPKWGESGKAFVVLHRGQQMVAQDVIDFCDGKLARFKIPKQVEFVAELPKGDSGKVLKRALRAGP